VKKHLIGALVLGVASMMAVTAAAQPPGGEGKGQPPGKGDGKGGFGQPPGKGGFPGQPGGKGGFGQGFGQRTQPGQIMSTFMQEQLKLNDDQKKQVAELQKEVDAKIEKLLTDEQKTQLKQIKEAGAGGFGGRPGGPGAPGGNPPPKKDPKN